jgi:hypothetical protein
MRVSAVDTRLVPLGLIAAIAASATPVRAAERALEYLAPAGCPSREEVSARIAARAPTGRDARIEVRPASRGFHGDLRLGDGDGDGRRRRRCAWVMSTTCRRRVDQPVAAAAIPTPTRREFNNMITL